VRPERTREVPKLVCARFPRQTGQPGATQAQISDRVQALLLSRHLLRNWPDTGGKNPARMLAFPMPYSFQSTGT